MLTPLTSKYWTLTSIVLNDSTRDFDICSLTCALLYNRNYVNFSAAKFLVDKGLVKPRIHYVLRVTIWGNFVFKLIIESIVTKQTSKQAKQT